MPREQRLRVQVPAHVDVVEVEHPDGTIDEIEVETGDDADAEDSDK